MKPAGSDRAPTDDRARFATLRDRFRSLQRRSLAVTLIVAMVREEWRLHGHLFDARRFALFPVFVTVTSAGAVWGLRATGTATEDVLLGFHALAFAFGLYTGSVGLVGRDALRNLLGDVTLVLFSARTLPVSPKRMVIAFLVKDVGFYAALFLQPLSIAFVAGAALAGDPFMPLDHPLLLASLTLVFALGIALTFAGIALATRGVGGRAGAVALGLVVGGLWLSDVDLLGLTPLELYRARGPGAAAVGGIATVVLVAVSLFLYDPTYSRPTRTRAARFEVWRRRLPGRVAGLLAKSLLDVRRSSGGLVKVVFSGAVLFGVTAFLLDVVASVTGVPPGTGVSFGAVLGLTAFTTYNWLTQFDSMDEYRALPVPVGDVFHAKFQAFLLCGLPTAVGFFTLAVALYGSPAADVLVGLVLLCGLSVYLFGLTVRLTGLSPNAFLFDTARFAGFTLAIAVPLVPVLVVGFVVPLTTVLRIGLGTVGLVAGGVGLALVRRSIPRWERRYRTA